MINGENKIKGRYVYKYVKINVYGLIFELKKYSFDFFIF